MRGPSILAVSLRRGLRRPTLSRSRLGSLVIFLFLALLSAFMVLPRSVFVRPVDQADGGTVHLSASLLCQPADL